MGRKGGGRSGFMKAVRHRDDEEEEAGKQPGPGSKPEDRLAEPSPTKPAQQGSKAQRFLKDEPGAAVGSSDEEEEPRREGGETRGQVVQRHKREVKALKDQFKRMGKKSKDEAAKLEEEMEKRHAAELAAFDAPRADTAAAVALAGSLYSVHLADGAENEAKQAKKPSKSQKRKEERARQQAEREARIAAELAELGDTDRVLEERTLKQLLAPLGLAIYDIPPDGHCLYRSVEHQLSQLAGQQAEQELQQAAEAGAAVAEAAESRKAEGPPSFLELRALAAEYMRAHADHFIPFVLEEVVEGEPSDAFEAYCQQVEQTAAWGGQPELQALGQALKAHIVVYSAGTPVLEVGEEFKGSGRTLRVCYLRHAYGLGEHYNSVRQGLVVSSDEESGDEDGGEPASASGS